MRIVVDAFGGDNAPLEIIKGAAAASKEYGVDITLTGKQEVIENLIKERNQKRKNYDHEKKKNIHSLVRYGNIGRTNLYHIPRLGLSRLVSNLRLSALSAIEDGGSSR